ncbi:MAG: alkaline phosphatase D family protein [Planctomycetota bacterium]
MAANETPTVAQWQGVPNRPWPGSSWWANRLQDWSVSDGALRCVKGPHVWGWRTAHLLTHDLNRTGDAFTVEVDLHRGATGRAGLLLGVGEGRLSYKQASMVQIEPGVGGGFLVEWSFESGELSLRDFGEDLEQTIPQRLPGHTATRRLGDVSITQATLVVTAQRQDTEAFRLTAQLRLGERVLAESSAAAPASRLVGGIALASLGSTPPDGHVFRAVRVGGERVAHHPGRAFGPIAGVLYSVANGDLKVGVQCVALGATRTPNSKQKPGSRAAVRLEVQNTSGEWEAVSHPVGIAEPDYYALIRLRGYDATQARDFRVVLHGLPGHDGPDPNYAFHVPAEPTDGQLAIGGVSCTGAMGRRYNVDLNKLAEGERLVGKWTPANVWMPWQGVIDPLMASEPDLLFFTGDQLYESNPTPRSPIDAFPVDDFLYKWLIWHWSFQEVTRKVPSVLQTDDHDVWHPNLWGDGGRLMTQGWDAGGGFLQSPLFVNLVQRAMCGHNPDPYDAGPLDSGVTNYFHTFSYGGVDFAVLEDRKFKSAAKEAYRQTEPQLLGDAQLRMLEQWNDQRTSDVRIVVSQTGYANLATRPNGMMTQDRDTHGWPKEARDRAVELFEANDAILFTGDQHLAAVARLETPNTDGPGVMQFGQPAAGCIWWRWFYPSPDLRRGPVPSSDGPGYLGRFVDGFGNPFEVLAVANPAPPDRVNDYPNPQRHRVSEAESDAGVGTSRRVHGGEGVALIRVDQPAGRIIFECWPLDADVLRGDAAQFPDWPIVFDIDRSD